MSRKLRIVFLGTPGFAVPCLDILIQNGYDVAAVVTATDKWGGRGGKKRLESAVKKYAVANDIPVLQPSNLKSTEFQEELKSYNANLQIVVAFRMLPESVWNMPKLGTFNLHGSLLPKYRGAAPIHWAVVNGDTSTGVTTFFLKHEIDTGDVMFQETLSIGTDETTGDVHDRMMILGAKTVLKTVQAIETDTVAPRPQDNSQATPAPKLKPENTKINFHQTAMQVHNFTRGLNPFPCAWTSLNGEKWKILFVQPITEAHQLTPGTIHSDGKSYFRIATTDGFVDVKELQVPGKRRMKVQDFLNGWRMEEAEILVFS